MQPVTPPRLYGVDISSSSSAVHPRWRLVVPRSPMQRRLHISRRFGFQHPTNHVGFVWFATVAMSYQRQQGPGVNTAFKGASRNLLMKHKFPRHEQRCAFDGRSGFRPRKTLAHRRRRFTLGVLADPGQPGGDMSAYVFLPKPELRSRRAGRREERASWSGNVSRGAAG